MLSDDMQPQSASTDDLLEESRYYWVTINMNGETIEISEQYIP